MGKDKPDGSIRSEDYGVDDIVSQRGKPTVFFDYKDIAAAEADTHQELICRAGYIYIIKQIRFICTNHGKFNLWFMVGGVEFGSYDVNGEFVLDIPHKFPLYLVGTDTIVDYITNLTLADSTYSIYVILERYPLPTGFTLPPQALCYVSPDPSAVGADVTCQDASGHDPTSWLWDFGDGSTSTEQNPVHKYATPGTYTVTLTAINAGGSDQDTATIVITA